MAPKLPFFAHPILSRRVPDEPFSPMKEFGKVNHLKKVKRHYSVKMQSIVVNKQGKR